MATSPFPSSLHLSPTFIESAGAILFRLSTSQICILRSPLPHAHPSSTSTSTSESESEYEYLLPKGRRNCGEAAPQAALREVTEETGFPCRLLPVTMATRAPPPLAGDGEQQQQQQQDLPDEARVFGEICEPVALQIRRLGEKGEGEGGVKVIWWYVAAVEEGEPVREDLREREKFTPEFWGYGEVLERLTFRMDREVVRKAIEIVEGTYGVVG